MKIAVPYKDGEIFQHFGKSENFKIYETRSVFVLESEVIGTEGAGHEDLADFLKSKEVQMVICGGMGDGAKAALAGAGIQVLAGASGDADAAVKACLNNELRLEAEDAGCSHGCSGSCSGHCH